MLLWIWTNSKCTGWMLLVLVILASPSFANRFLLRNSSIWCPWIIWVSSASSSSLMTSSPKSLVELHILPHYVMTVWKSKKASPFPKITSGALWWPWETDIPLLTTLALRWASTTCSQSSGSTEALFSCFNTIAKNELWPYSPYIILYTSYN